MVEEGLRTWTRNCPECDELIEIVASENEYETAALDQGSVINVKCDCGAKLRYKVTLKGDISQVTRV